MKYSLCDRHKSSRLVREVGFLLVTGVVRCVPGDRQWGVDSTRLPCAAVLLAAGAGSRFTGPGHKLLAPFRGSTVFGTSLAAVSSAGFDVVIVVTGAADLSDEPGLRAPGTGSTRVETVHNDHWAAGQSGSLHRALERARELGFGCVVVGLADQPMVTTSAWRMVAEASATPIAVATYDGRRGNPVRLHESIWDRLPRTGDIGARDLIRLHPELVSQVACEGSEADIDTHEDLDTWT